MNRRQLTTAIAIGVAGTYVSAQPIAGEKVGQRSSSRSKVVVEKSPRKLVFGLITPRNPELTLKSWNPFIERIARAVGVSIEARTFAGQGELVKEFLANRIDLAWLGNSPALDIVEADKGHVFAAMVVQGKTAYR